MGVTGIAVSLAVNALVTGLIVFRIFKVFRQVKRATLDDQILGVAGGTPLRRIIFILIESGMALFSIQLVRLVLTLHIDIYAAFELIQIVVNIHELLNVIIRSVHC